MPSDRSALARAAALLGPLEGRIMRAVWSGAVEKTFVVRNVQELMPELAYTTVMTTLARLAQKGLLTAKSVPGQKAHRYRAAGGPRDFLAQASRQDVGEIVRRYGDAALAAFAEELDRLSDERRRRLEELIK
jgi:predicted transcriptional regulator